MKTAFITGASGHIGANQIRPLLKKSCDNTLNIPMEGSLGSLNASAAAAVIFYETLRQKNLGS